MGEKIDILLATYNGEKYIKEQIDSILQQSYKNIKLIISDDGSKDKTLEIIKEIMKTDNRIELYEQEENLGSTKNFEFLLSKVTANYYMLSDQDDIWKMDKVEKTFEYLKLKEADLVFCDLSIVDSELKLINKSFTRYKNLYNKIMKFDDYRRVYLYNCVTGCTIISKSKFIKEFLPFPVGTKYLIHDFWIALYLSLNGKVCYLDEPLVMYRQHTNNQIGSKRVSSTLGTFEELRNLFLNVKIELFTTFVDKEEIFSEELRKLNKENLEYFIMLSKKNNFNFKNWNIFHRLYKYEKFSYYILNFFILNLPCLSRMVFKLRNIIKG